MVAAPDRFGAAVQRKLTWTVVMPVRVRAFPSDPRVVLGFEMYLDEIV